MQHPLYKEEKLTHKEIRFEYTLQPESLVYASPMDNNKTHISVLYKDHVIHGQHYDCPLTDILESLLLVFPYGDYILENTTKTSHYTFLCGFCEEEFNYFSQSIFSHFQTCHPKQNTKHVEKN